MLDNLKALLGLPEEDVSQDKKLQLILDAAKSRLKLLLGGIEPPEELNYIILDVAIIRFSRIGSEGLSSHTVEGAFPGLIMILPDIWMIFVHLWTARKR